VEERTYKRQGHQGRGRDDSIWINQERSSEKKTNSRGGPKVEEVCGKRIRRKGRVIEKTHQKGGGEGPRGKKKKKTNREFVGKKAPYISGCESDK